MKGQHATLPTSISTVILDALVSSHTQPHVNINLAELLAALAVNNGLQSPTQLNDVQESEPQTWYTVKQHAKVEPAFSESALRNLVFKASSRKSTKGVIPGNGLIEAGAIQRVGGKVLLHRARFLAWIEQQGSKARGGQS